MSARLAFVLAAAIYGLLGLVTASSWEFAHDEGVTWEQAFGALPLPADSQPALAVGELLPWVEGARPFDPSGIAVRLGEEGGMHPPLYYLGVAGWTGVFGAERLVAVLPMLGLGIALLGVLLRIGRELAPGGLPVEWAAALLATSPWWIGFSVYARPYAWVVFLSGVATLAALRFARGLPGAGEAGGGPGRASDGQLAWALVFALTSVAGLYSLYHYAFVLLWHAALLVAVALKRPAHARAAALIRVVAIGAAIAVCFAPWLPTLAGHLAETRARPWYFSSLLPVSAWPAEGLRALRFFALAAAERADGLPRVVLPLGATTAALALYSFRPERWRGLSPEARCAWACALLMPLGIVASDWLRDTHTFFLTKIHFAWALLLPILVVRAASEISRPFLARALLVGWLVLHLLACAWIVFDQRGESSLERMAGLLSRGDGDEHRIVISTSLHGYAQPFVHALTEAGVRESRIQVVGGPRLAGFVRRTLREAEVERISLVNLAAFYQPGAMWNSKQVQAAIDAALASGWRTVPQDQLRGDEVHVLGYSLPLQVRYFSK